MEQWLQATEESGCIPKAPDLIWRVFQDNSLMDYKVQVISIREMFTYYLTVCQERTTVKNNCITTPNQE